VYSCADFFGIGSLVVARNTAYEIMQAATPKASNATTSAVSALLRLLLRKASAT
jgi:hypothetical protein